MPPEDILIQILILSGYSQETAEIQINTERTDNSTAVIVLIQEEFCLYFTQSEKSQFENLCASFSLPFTPLTAHGQSHIPGKIQQTARVLTMRQHLQRGKKTGQLV